MKNIFEYASYRTFLKEYYEERKALEGYTYRDFSKATGMNSSSWLMHLIKGVKNLSDDTTARIAKALHFSRHETEYFNLLVHFTQAEKSETKNLFFNQMLDLKKKLKIIRISEQQYEYYTKWYYPVIRSLVSKVAWNGNYGLLAKKLLPPITQSEAKKSVALLEKLGFIEKDAKVAGKWVQKNDIITTGDEVMSLNVVNYHKQVTKLAENAFDRSTKEWRDISSLTLGINRNDVRAIKAKIQQFRKEIIEIARASENADRVYQLNFHFFPVSKSEERENVSD
jgi:uncharacterized protein (TIGR02147 family)